MLRVMLVFTRIIIFISLLFTVSIHSQSLHEIGLFNNAPAMNNGGDKILHFTFSYVIAYETYRYFEPRVGSRKAKVYSIIVPVAAGLGKEFVDYKWRKGAEGADLIADGLGITLFILEF